MTRPIISKPPIGGINLTLPETELPFQYALELDNWTITGGKLRIRDGYTSAFPLTPGRDGYGTLRSFNINANKVLLAATGGFLRSILPANEILLSDTDSDKWSFATQSGHLLMVNGFDNRYWDGVTLTTPAYTATPSNSYIGPFDGVVSHNEHAYFWVEGSSTFYHLDPAAVQGPIYQFPLGNLGNIEGTIVEMASWTVDASHGSNDVLVILTDEGDAVLYEGLDPTDGNDFRLMGRYKMPCVLPGGRATVKYGADLLVMTQEGIVSLTNILQQGVVAATEGFMPETMPLEADWAKHATPQTTDAILDRSGKAVIFSMTDENGDIRQVVKGLSRGRPTTWSGIDAVSWAFHDKALYFMDTGGNVHEIGGHSDNGKSIQATHKSGWSPVNDGYNVTMKGFVMALKTPGPVSVSTRVSMDFEEQPELTGPVLFEPDCVGDGNEFTVLDANMGAAGNGKVAQVRSVIDNGGESVEWIGTKFLVR